MQVQLTAKVESERRQRMTNSERRNWMDNLQNAAQEACKQSGVNTVTSYLLQHYGVSSLEELSTTDYDRVFDDLDFMASDLK